MPIGWIAQKLELDYLAANGMSFMKILKGMEMELVEENKKRKTSEHNQVWKGKAVKLDLVCYVDGIKAIYYIEQQHPMVPSQTLRQAITSAVVKERFWHRWFGIDDAKRTAKAVKLLKENWEEIQHNTKVFNNIMEDYGVKAHDE